MWGTARPYGPGTLDLRDWPCEKCGVPARCEPDRIGSSALKQNKHQAVLEPNNLVLKQIPSIHTLFCNLLQLVMALFLDTKTEVCGICMETLDCYPSGDPATSEMGLCRAPCNHWFHGECAHIGFPACPICRATWAPALVDHHILGDFEDEFQVFDDDGSDSESGDPSDDDTKPLFIETAKWDRFIDPESCRIFWQSAGNTDAFWETDSDWTKYIYEGRRWWGNGVDWFFVDTGTRF